MDRLLPARLGGLPLLAERGPADCPTHQRADREHPPIPLRRDRKAGTPQEPDWPATGLAASTVNTGSCTGSRASPSTSCRPATTTDGLPQGRRSPPPAGSAPRRPRAAETRRATDRLRRADLPSASVGKSWTNTAGRGRWEGNTLVVESMQCIIVRAWPSFASKSVTDPPSRQSAAASLPATPLRCGGRCSSDDRRGRQGCRTVPRRTGPTAPARPSRRPRRPV